MNDVEIRFDNAHNRVQAYAADTQVGSVSIPESVIDWGMGTLVPAAGIAAVGTDEALRGKGVASRMMRRAVEESTARGYAVGCVSTGIANVSRRLYARSGYTHIFSVDTFHKEPRRVDPAPPPPGVTVRPYRPGDERGAAALRKRLYSDTGFFGAFERTPERWLAGQKELLEKEPECFWTAERDGRIVGTAEYLVFWEGREHCEFNIEQGPDEHPVAIALLTRLERACATTGRSTFRFDASIHQAAVREALHAVGCTRLSSFVFNIALLDLQSLLDRLKALVQSRLERAGAACYPGTLRVRTPDMEGRITLDGGETDRETTLSGDASTVTRVLCGRMSAHEAYLRGRLDIGGSFDENAHRALPLYLGRVPYLHAMRDRD